MNNAELREQLNKWQIEVKAWQETLQEARQSELDPKTANTYRYVGRRLEDMLYHIRASKDKLDTNIVEFSL